MMQMMIRRENFSEKEKSPRQFVNADEKILCSGSCVFQASDAEYARAIPFGKILGLGKSENPCLAVNSKSERSLSGEN